VSQLHLIGKGSSEFVVGGRSSVSQSSVRLFFNFLSLHPRQAMYVETSTRDLLKL